MGQVNSPVRRSKPLCSSSMPLNIIVVPSEYLSTDVAQAVKPACPELAANSEH